MIAIAEPQLKCIKWCKTGARYQCVQCETRPRGCNTLVNFPPISNLLHERQKEYQEDYINRVKANLKTGQAALVLGAGISKPSEMPLWGPLISKMMGYAIQYDLAGNMTPRFYTKDTPEGSRLLEQSKKMINGDLRLLGRVNPLEAAEYVAQLFYDRKSTGHIRRKLEEAAVSSMICRIVDASKTPKDLLFSEDHPFSDLEKKVNGGVSLADAVKEAGTAKKKVIAEQNTMFAVSHLLSAENGIRCAMTYNYDPLVQEHMLDLFGIEEAQLVTHPGRWNETAVGVAGTREIFHVHGFVPGQRHLARHCGRIFPSLSGPLVLSEDSYYRIEREEAYNWSSSIQSYLLNKYNCLFVGFSADDYNFRRILRQRGDKDNADPSCPHYHYLILTIDDWIQDIYQDVCSSRIRKKDSTVSKDELESLSQDSILLLQYALDARVHYWERFNIIPIWITINEIPHLLTSLLTP